MADWDGFDAQLQNDALRVGFGAVWRQELDTQTAASTHWRSVYIFLDAAHFAFRSIKNAEFEGKLREKYLGVEIEQKRWLSPFKSS